MASRPILIAYDGSPEAEHAIRTAAGLFGPQPAHIVSVWSPLLNTAPVAGGIPAYLSDLDPKLEESAQNAAERGAEIAREAGFEADAGTAKAASAWQAIVSTADEIDAAAIVVGARGLSRLKSIVLGSTSNGVLHHASRPVLVVRAEQV